MCDAMHPPAPDKIVLHPLFARAAIAATLLLPLALLYSRAIGDILVSSIAILFLLDRWARRDWAWTRSAWTRLALLFWLWMMICTCLAGTAHAIGEGLASLRLFVFVAALENFVLPDRDRHRQLTRVILATAAWIAIESWQQYLFGVNIFGVPRSGDGALTGPLFGLRAGPTYVLVFFPAWLPPIMRLLGHSRAVPRVGGVLLLIVGVETMVLIGQRMPTLLLVLGLAISGLLLRRFRWPVVGAVLCGALLLAATPIVSPPTYAKLVLHFYQQMEHFWESQYGLLFVRAAVMVQAHPWIGLGFDGFRDNCDNPGYYFQSIAWLGLHDTGDSLGCSIHPHNYWLQIATSAGLPGLLLFGALVAVWLRGIGRGLLAVGDPLRVALFVTVCVAFWPIASTTSLFTLPNAGWTFLMIGWGLAEARGHAAAVFPLGAKML